MNSREVLAGGLILGLSGALFWQSGRIPAPPLIPIGPAFYPRIILLLLALLGMALVVETLVGRPAPAPRPAWGPQSRRGWLVVLCFVLFGLYTAALPWLGYRLSTALFVAATQWGLGTRTLRSVPPSLLVGVATAFVTYGVFQLYLHVLLPRGALIP